jgi:HPt (histidine-containing phosphotransfer) domain-containing protein
MSFSIPEGQLYDLKLIHEIAHGNTDFVKKMVRLFIDTMPPALAEMRQHLNDSNWKELGAVAHKIKPSIDTMGIELLREDIRTIERYAKESSNIDELPALMDKLEGVLQKVMVDLNVEL